MIQTWNWKNQGISLSKAINLGISSLAVLQYLNNISFLLTIIIILLLFLFLHSIQPPQYNHDKLKKGSHIKPVGTNMAQHQRYIQVCSNIYYTRENTHNQNSSSVILFSCRRNSSRRRSSSRRRYADDDDDTGTNGVVLFSRECVLLTFFFYFTSNNNCSSLLFHVCSFLVAQVNNIWFTVSSSPSAAAFSPCGYNQMVRKPFCCPLNIEVKWPNTIKICRYYHTTKTITYNLFLYNGT